jgi:hypothetical protein
MPGAPLEFYAYIFLTPHLLSFFRRGVKSFYEFAKYKKTGGLCALRRVAHILRQGLGSCPFSFSHYIRPRCQEKPTHIRPRCQEKPTQDTGYRCRANALSQRTMRIRICAFYLFSGTASSAFSHKSTTYSHTAMSSGLRGTIGCGFSGFRGRRQR